MRNNGNDLAREMNAQDKGEKEREGGDLRQSSGERSTGREDLADDRCEFRLRMEQHRRPA
ncbi:MAG: hypothetical protein ACREF9_18385 [Opitutaceae bacterium]